MDLSTIDFGAAGAAELILLHPVTQVPLKDVETGEDVSITLVGIDSDTYKVAERKVTNAKLARVKGARGSKFTAEEIESNKVELLAACIVGWKNIALDGVNVDYNPVNAKKLLLKAGWVAEQVEEFVEDRSNFLKQK